MPRFTHFLNLFLLIAAGSSAAFAQGYVNYLPDDVKNPFLEKHKLIKEELEKSAPNEWTGTYYKEPSPTWSEMLFWEPVNGFAAFRDTCSSGPRAWVNYGEARFQDGVVSISPQRPKGAENLLEFEFTKFTPVRWGQQHWLVPTDQLALFAYAVNSRSGEEDELFFLKTDDREIKPTGKPDLTPQYKALLGMPAIKASVVSLDETKGDWYPEMTIDAGKNKRVIKDMSFWLTGHKGLDFQIKVSEVYDQTSKVYVVMAGRSGDFDGEIVPKRGWRFSSKMR